jgi:hypothetical protein
MFILGVYFSISESRFNKITNVILYADPSEWERVYQSPAMPIYSACLGAFALSVVILAVYKQSV